MGPRARPAPAAFRAGCGGSALPLAHWPAGHDPPAGRGPGGSEGAAPSSGGRREAGGERRVGRSGACGRPHRPSPRLPPTPSPAPRGVVPAGDPLGRQGSPGTRSFAKPLPPTRKPQRAQRGYLRSPAQEPACATPPEPRGPSPLAPPRGLRSSPAVPLLHPSSALSRKPPARAAPARFNGTLATCLRVGVQGAVPAQRQSLSLF